VGFDFGVDHGDGCYRSPFGDYSSGWKKEELKGNVRPERTQHAVAENPGQGSEKGNGEKRIQLTQVDIECPIRLMPEGQVLEVVFLFLHHR
jgi:hypothetical protein